GTRCPTPARGRPRSSSTRAIWRRESATPSIRSVLAAGNEAEAVGGAPAVVEAFEAELAPARVAPEAQDVAATEVAEPRIVEQHPGPLALHFGMGDSEVERILVRRRLEALPRPLARDVASRHVAIESEENDLAPSGAAEVPGGKVLRIDGRMRVAVA